MIEKMHEKSKGFAFKAIFAFVTLSFVLGGIGGTILSTRGGDYVAKVNGDKISKSYFERIKNNAQNNAARESGENFWNLMENENFAKMFNKQILDSLIKDVLVKQYVERLNLAVTAEQIKVAIVNDPQFQKDGKFNNEYYQSLLRNNNISPDSYAAMVAERLLLTSLNKSIFASDFLVEKQKSAVTQLLLQKRKVKILDLKLANEVAQTQVSEKELKEYFNANKNRFLTDETLDIELVSISPKDLMSNINVADDEVNDYYAKNSERFTTKGKTEIADITLKTKEEAEQVFQELKNGSDFADVVVKYSQDPLTKSNGGKLGDVKNLPKMFQEIASVVGLNDLSKPFEFEGKFHIIKVLAKTPDVKKELAQVKDEIVAILKQEQAFKEYSTAVNEMSNRAFEQSNNLKAVAEVASLDVKTFDKVTLNNLPDELKNEKYQNVLNNQDLRQSHMISSAIDLTEGNIPKTAFMRIVKFDKPKPQTFEMAKEQVTLLVKEQKALVKLQGKAEKLLADVKDNKVVNFSDKEELNYFQAATISEKFAQNIFAMNLSDNNVAKVDLGKNILIVKLEEIINEKPSALDANIGKSLEQGLSVSEEQALIENLKNQSTIEYNEE